ncbi:hypothetical protein B5V02_18500 [Mesorhizobium kowhaii]|uniref:Uncharacterized protein n=1 Tax=Mesorhizobium kowhaii TaxID=1300272 RepID=A0A2W7CTH4_9HYPH|nr:hypothetical protein B5V02_18500 [Mesorhizobium kowhaii]
MEWIGPDHAHWPQRACVQAELEHGIRVEVALERRIKHRRITFMVAFSFVECRCANMRSYHSAVPLSM